MRRNVKMHTWACVHIMNRLQYLLSWSLTSFFMSLQSLCGCSVTVSTIDGKTCNMKITDVIKPGMRKTVAGQGLPLPKNPEQRGDLVVEFDVNFPETLPGNAKDVLKRHLPAWGEGHGQSKGWCPHNSTLSLTYTHARMHAIHRWTPFWQNVQCLFFMSLVFFYKYGACCQIYISARTSLLRWLPSESTRSMYVGVCHIHFNFSFVCVGFVDEGVAKKIPSKHGKKLFVKHKAQCPAFI